jgi:hypothetical protein
VLQDFALRFALHAEVILQFDNDFFLYAPPSIDGKPVGPLRNRIRALMDSNPDVGQFLVAGKWFGACNASAKSGKPFVLDQSIPDKPLYAQPSWRYDPVGWYPSG